MDNTQSTPPQLTGGEIQDKAEMEQEKTRVEAEQATEPRKLTTRDDVAGWLAGGYVTLTSDVLPTEASSGAVEKVQVPISWLLELFYEQKQEAERAVTAATPGPNDNSGNFA